jgi:hypothetical protein
MPGPMSRAGLAHGPAHCGARFADRNELLAHLEAEKQRDQTAPEP